MNIKANPKNGVLGCIHTVDFLRRYEGKHNGFFDNIFDNTFQRAIVFQYVQHVKSCGKIVKDKQKQEYSAKIECDHACLMQRHKEYESRDMLKAIAKILVACVFVAVIIANVSSNITKNPMVIVLIFVNMITLTLGFKVFKLVLSRTFLEFVVANVFIGCLYALFVADFSRLHRSMVEEILLWL